MEPVNAAVAIYLCSVMVILGLACVIGEFKNKDKSCIIEENDET
jgi:hypothetical protein